MPIRSAALFLTQDCNLRCRYCYIPKQPLRMSQSVGEETTDFMLSGPADVDTVSIFFFGGEPMMEWELLQHLVSYGEDKAAQLKRRIHFGVTTNGTIFDEGIDRFFAEHRVSVNLSVDGAPETQDANRRTVDGRGTSQKVLGTLDALLKRNPRQSVRMTYDTHSVADLYENIRFFWDRGCWTVSPSPAIEDSWDEATFGIAREQIQRIAEDVLDMMRHDDYKRIGFLEKGIQRVARPRKQRPRAQCGAGRSYVAVSPSGDIYPCHRFAGYNAYHFGDLDSVICPDNRELFLTFDSNALPPCDSCRAREICAGGCPAANFACTGTVMRPSSAQCEFIRMQYDVSKWMFETLRDEGNEQLQKVLSRKAQRSRGKGKGKGKGKAA